MHLYNSVILTCTPIHHQAGSYRHMPYNLEQAETLQLYNVHTQNKTEHTIALLCQPEQNYLPTFTQVMLLSKPTLAYRHPHTLSTGVGRQLAYRHCSHALQRSAPATFSSVQKRHAQPLLLPRETGKAGSRSVAL